MDAAWDHDNRTVLLQRCVGLESFGLEPDVAEIRRSRVALGEFINDTLRLTPEDVVLDLGSGPGFIASFLAPKVRHLHCADISKGYLALCREEVARLNVSCHLIPFADLSALYDRGITAIYASAVFVHFNVYDICLHLQECFTILPAGGRVWLDFKSTTHLTIDDARFRRHMEVYKADRRKIERVLNYHHPETIEDIAHQVGFISTRHDGERPEGRALDNHHVLLLTKP